MLSKTQWDLACLQLAWKSARDRKRDENKRETKPVGSTHISPSAISCNGPIAQPAQPTTRHNRRMGNVVRTSYGYRIEGVN